MVHERPLPSASPVLRTTFLIPDLHCPSCAIHIEQTLSRLVPPPSLVSFSIISHTVTVEHETTLDPSTLTRALIDVGYEISDMQNYSATPDSHQFSEEEKDTENGLFNDALKPWPSDKSAAETKERDIDVENCEQCPADGAEEMGSPSAQLTVAIDNASRRTTLHQATLILEGMTCSSCVDIVQKALEDKTWMRSADVSLVTHSASVVFEGDDPDERVTEVLEAVEEIGYAGTIDQIQEIQLSYKSPPAPLRDIWQASYAIDGMTCSSCVGKIDRAVQALRIVENVDINLISRSGTVSFEGKDRVREITDAIEDTGYGPTLDELVALGRALTTNASRSISIRVAGLHCDKCPDRIREALSSVGPLSIDKMLSLEDPIVKVTYTPHSPDFTIRSILATIAEIDDSFRPSIHHPPSLEERSRKMLEHELRHIMFRVLLSTVIAIPALIIGIVYMNLVSQSNSGYRYLMTPLAGVSRAEWASFALATPVYFFAADLFHRRTLKELYNMWKPGSRVPILRRFCRFGSMNMLISFGTSIAYFASIAELIISAITLKPSSNPSYFDSVVFLTMFLLIGRLIEAHMKTKSGNAVAALGKLRPNGALLIDVDMVEVGDIIRVVNGGSPPCDGLIVEGETKFDESSLTGESKAVSKTIGDTIFSGTINKAAPISLRATGVVGRSMLDSIIEIVREGQAKRAPVERIANLITGYFVPAVVLVVILTWITWLALGISGVLPSDYRRADVGGWPFWSLQFAIAVFVIACPCGLGLAAPTALFVGGGLAAKHGILVKGGGEAFQEASELDCIVFDKTGTLTEGKEPKISDLMVYRPNENCLGEAEVFGVLRRLEEDSNHPLAKAALDFIETQKAVDFAARNVEEIAGKGIVGRLQSGNGRQLLVEALVGNEALMMDYGVIISEEARQSLGSWSIEGKSVMLVASRVFTGLDLSTPPWVLSATLAASDPLRPESIKVVSALKQRGIDVWMTSGDNQKTAAAVAGKVGILTTNVIAGVLPDQKAEKVKYLQKTLSKRISRPIMGFRCGRAPKRATVAMVGDGINDSPALTVADVGIAIGSGSDVAISSAEFILITSNLTSLLTLTDLSRVVFRRIKFNFGWAAIYNMVALPVAAGVLYPIRSGGSHVRLDPSWAALAMALSSISVICSSLLLRTRLPVVGFRAKTNDL